MLPESSRELERLRAAGERLGVGFVVPAGPLLTDDLPAALTAAEALRAPTVRCTLSTVLCGERNSAPGGWPDHLKRCRARIEELLPEFERAGVALALENHQDADSSDLLNLCTAFESRYLGVTLDCANPLAVMEHPVEFARRLAPYLRHSHLKDYRIHHAATGCRLVRCAVGSGVVNFPELLQLFTEQEWPITTTIEMGALEARLIPFLEARWWDNYPGRSLSNSVSALRVIWDGVRPRSEDWRTPFEKDSPGSDLALYERRQLNHSVSYLRALKNRNAVPAPADQPFGA